MEIKLAQQTDIKQIMEVISDAKSLLKKSGSMQWNTPDGYPNEDVFINDIKKDNLYALWDNDILVGIMACVTGIDENYEEIEGNWITNGPYLTIHRIAIRKEYYHTKSSHKLINYAINLAKELHCISIKVDTHPLNIPMQKLLLFFNFIHCGTITLKRSKIDNLRLAYELKL